MIKRIMLAFTLLVSLFFVGASSATAAGSGAAPIGAPPATSAADKPAVAPKHQGYKGQVVPSSGIHTNVLGPTNFTYAGAQQTPATAPTSVNALATVDNPWLSVNYEWHTLAEVALSSANGQQTVEVGWTEDPTTFGDSKPRLFVYSWVNGVGQGYNAHFTNYASRVNTVGDDLTSFIDTVPQFGWTYSAGNWWASFNGSYLGYFPGSNWSGVTPTFNNAHLIQFFGEISGRSSPCTDMGSNPAVLATSTTGSKFSSITYDGLSTGVSVAPFYTNAAWYNAALIAGSTRTFYYGGPGPC
jgi:hypothetical protein